MAVTHRIDQTFNSLPHSIIGIGAFIILSIFLFNKYTVRQRQKQYARENGCKPITAKFPLMDPIFGIDQIIAKLRLLKQNRLLESNHQSLLTLGPTWGTKVFGHTVVVTSEPENVKTILSLKFKDFGLGAREQTLGRLLGSGIFTTDGERWAHSRAMIRPNFTRDQVADLDAFERHIQTLFQLLPRDGSNVDLQEYFFKFTIDSATEFLFGKSTHTLQAELAGTSQSTGSAGFAEAFNAAQFSVAVRSRLGLLRKIYRDKAGDAAIKVCHDFVDQYVDEAVLYRQRMEDLERKGVTGHEDKYMFLHELAKNTKDKKRLRDELLNVLLAGRDTTASLLSNMWLVIARRPDIFAKLKQEVNDTLDGRLPTYQELRNMKYLKYCMNESLRLHPVVPMNARIALRDTFIPLGGGPDGKSPLFIAKDHVVQYSTYGMHRRKDYYGEDAEEFKPERWETLRPGWEYLPFNGGPRICIGQQYALTEAGYVTVRLLQEFSRVDNRDSEPWTESLTLTLCSKNGTVVALTPA